MIDKEIRSASWKFGFVALIVLVTLTQIPTPYEEIVENMEFQRDMSMGKGEIPPPPGDFQMTEREAEEMFDPVDRAMNELSGLYVVGGAAGIALLAGLLGAGLVSGEVGGGTIFALLSRPISRTRLFFTKYIVCAAFLLAAAVLGAVALFVVAWLRDYPFGEITWPGVVLAVFLMWLASLFVLGVAILVSILTRNTMQSLIVTAVIVLLILNIPNLIMTFAEIFLWNEFDYENNVRQMEQVYEAVQALTLNNYWPDSGYFWPGANRSWEYIDSMPGGSKILDFVVCSFAAAIPFLAALWLFNRKKF